MRIRLSLIAFTLIMGVLISGCKEKKTPAKSDEELQIEKLSKTWVLAAESNPVTVDGNDVSTNWTGFTLTLGDKTYQSTGSDSPEVWPASGSWEFGSNVNTLVRDAGIDISISVTDQSLLLQFDYTVAGGRLSGIEGTWVFNMVPQ